MIILLTKNSPKSKIFLFIANLKKSDGWVLVRYSGIKKWDKETKLISEKKEKKKKEKFNYAQ